jgi:hypothetical protein
MKSTPLLDRAGRRRSPATTSSFHQGLSPKGRDFVSGFLPTPPHDDAVALGLWLVPSTSTGDSHPRAAAHAGRTM